MFSVPNAPPDGSAIMPPMKIRRLRLLLLTLFLLALGGEALHTLSAHHDASHCSVCSFQANDVGTDCHADNGAGDVFIAHEAPRPPAGPFYRFTVLLTFFGRAPPLPLS